jgi:hypothetical protein
MVIEKSAKNPGEKVNKPGSDEKVLTTELSRTGGIINAYEAIKLASTIKGERKPAPQPKPNTKVVAKPKG